MTRHPVPHGVLAVLEGGHRPRGQVDGNTSDHDGPVLEQILLPYDPSVSLARPEFHEEPIGLWTTLIVSTGPQKKRAAVTVPVNLENDCAVAAGESQFPKPRLQEAEIRGGFKVPHHNLHRIRPERAGYCESG